MTRRDETTRVFQVMGDFFLFYPKRRLSSALTRRSFAAGRGREPLPTETRVEKYSEDRNLLIAHTNTYDSCSLYVPYVDDADGFFFASTETLPPSPRFRSLFLELARGQLSRLIKRRVDWISSGLRVPQSLNVTTRRAIARFAVLATSDYDDPNFDAKTFSFFRTLCEISRRYNELFLEKVLAARRNLDEPWDTKFGFAASIGSNWTAPYDAMFSERKGGRKPRLDPVFQTFYPQFSWANVERADGVYDWTAFDAALAHAEFRGLKTTLGPLVRWNRGLPDWLVARPDALEYVSDAFLRFVNATLTRDGGRTQRWIVATNVEYDDKEPSFETRLTLAAKAAFAIRSRFPRAQVFLGFEQAFGDGCKRRRPRMSAFELAQRISRRNTFDGYYLEANFGLSSLATSPRDPMELHRFFERWSSLGVPLVVATSCPSAQPARLSLREEPTRLFSGSPEETKSRFFRPKTKSVDDHLTSEQDELPDATLWSEKTQRELTRRFFSSAAARRSVDELVWTRWIDAPPVELDADERAEEAADYLLPEPTQYQTPPPIVVNEIPLLNDDDEVEIELANADVCVNESATTLGPSTGKRDQFPTSGLFDEDLAPKPTLYKLSAIRRAYID